MTDFHSHLIPGVDDGAADLDQARAALRAFQAQEVRSIVATPHFDASLTHHRARFAARIARIDEGWEALRALAAAEFPGLRLERGVELMLDTPTPELDDARLRLAGTSFVLVEFGALAVPPNAADAFDRLTSRGLTPVVAHPERYAAAQVGWSTLEAWRERGCRFQVNTGSLLGHYGSPARRMAVHLLQRGAADYLSSDYHARGIPSVRPCRELLLQSGGREQVRLLLAENPRRLLEDLPPLPVPPLSTRLSLLDRLRDYLG